MRLRKLGHSCLLLEEGDTRLLLDPGTFSSGFEELEDLTAVLITHSHPDHLDVDRVVPLLLERNPGARVVADRTSVAELRGHGVDARPVDDGDELRLGDVDVAVRGSDHAVIHPDIPGIPNVGYAFDGGRVFYPGDALTVPPEDVSVLCLPTTAPWCKGAETVDFLRAVAPRTAVPVHDGLLAVTDVHYGLFRQLAPDRTTLTVPDGPLEV